MAPVETPRLVKPPDEVHHARHINHPEANRI